MTERFESTHVWGALLATAIFVVAAAACGPNDHGPTTGSNSNWLVACVDEGECGQAGSCLCGACSRQCTNDSDCADLDNAYCGANDQTAAATLCGGGSQGAGLCLPRCTPGSCRVGQSCVAGGCVLGDIPDSAFCRPVADPSTEERLNEDELLTLIQENRASGSIACESGALVPSAPPLRLDGRLRCAARVKAVDQESTGTTGLSDSLGRDAPERMELAGYSGSNWWESYAFNADSATQAYEILMGDADSCPELGNGTYTAVGVGNAGGVYVVTLASD